MTNDLERVTSQLDAALAEANRYRMSADVALAEAAQLRQRVADLGRERDAAVRLVESYGNGYLVRELRSLFAAPPPVSPESIDGVQPSAPREPENAGSIPSLHHPQTPRTAERQRNQCDGCRRGLPVDNGIHREPGDQWGGMGCTASRYGHEEPHE